MVEQPGTSRYDEHTLGFRSLCDNYQDILELKELPQLRIADMSKGKSNDDGYRGIHVYYQLDGNHYPIEIKEALEHVLSSSKKH